jgi:hypothetical protein
MPRFSAEQKERAKELYMKGVTPAKIANQISTEYSVSCAANTVHSWAKSGNWDDLRKEVVVAAVQNIREIAVEDEQALLTKEIAGYQQVIDAAQASIASLEGKPIPIKGGRDFVDVAKGLDIGVRGKQAIQSGALSVQFLTDVMTIILDVVTDEAMVRDISVRLKQLALKEVAKVSH